MSSHRYKNNPSIQPLYIWKACLALNSESTIRNDAKACLGQNKVFELNPNFYSSWSNSITLMGKMKTIHLHAILVPYPKITFKWLRGSLIHYTPLKMPYANYYLTKHPGLYSNSVLKKVSENNTSPYYLGPNRTKGFTIVLLPLQTKLVK